MEDFLFSLGATFIAASIAGLSQILARRARQAVSARRAREAASVQAEIERLAKLANSMGVPPHRLLSQNESSYVDRNELQVIRSKVARIEKRLTDETTDRPAVDATEIEGLSARIARLEERLPDDSNLDMLASVNDALLAKGLERAEKRITHLGEQALTKWDVATVVFAILAAGAALVGAVLAITKLASG